MPNSSPTVANRRASRRQHAKRSTAVICQKGRLGLGRNLADGILDVSETGIRLVAREALGPGQEVVVTLRCYGQRRPHELAGAVVWCVATSDGRFCAGIRFEKSLPYSELQTLASL